MDLASGARRQLATTAACAVMLLLTLESKASDRASDANPAAAQTKAPTQSPSTSTSPSPSQVQVPTQGEDVVELGSVKAVAVPSFEEGLYSTTAKSVVDRASIEKYGDSSLADALRRVSGVTVDEEGGRRVVRMRGLGTGYTQILINGQPVPAGFSIDSLSVALIDRIEIVRVPTADASAQAIAGTVNIILLEAGPRSERSIKASGSREGGAEGYDASVRLAGKNGESPYSMALSAGRAHFDRPSVITETGWDPGGERNLKRMTLRENRYAVDTLGLVANVRRGPDADNFLSFELLATDRHAAGHNFDRTDTEAGMLPEYSSSNIIYTSDNADVRGTLKWARDLTGTARIEADLSAAQIDRKSEVVFQGFDVDRVLVRDRQVHSEGSDRTLTLNGKYVFPLSDAHSFDAGLQAEGNSRSELRVQNDFTPTGLPPVDLDESYDADVWRLAFYAQDEWVIRDDLSAYLGLRWEGVRTTTRGNNIPTITSSIDVWSPVLQAVLRLSEEDSEQLRLGVSRTFKPPLPVELVPRRFISNNNTPTSPDARGNPGLQAEVATGLDIAYERALPGGMLSLSSYGRRIDGVIVPQLLFEDGRWISVPFNVGTATVYGVESEARFNLAELWSGAPGLNMRFSLAKNWSDVSHVQGPDNTLGRQIPLVASFGGDYRFSALNTVVGADYKFEKSRDSRTSETVLTSESARRALDLYAVSEVSEGVKLRAAISNLLGVVRHTGVTYASAAGVLVQDTAVPTETMVRVTLEITL